MFSGREMEVRRPGEVSSSVLVVVLIVVVVLVLSRHFVEWVSAHCHQLPHHTRVSACVHARAPLHVCGLLRGLAQIQDSDEHREEKGTKYASLLFSRQVNSWLF